MKHYRKGILLIALMAILVASHFQLRESSPLYNFFFSPPDLYNNLAESTIDLTETGSTAVLKATHNYPGNHWLAILVENPTELFEKYNSDFKLKITITNNNKVVFNSTVTDSSSWFLGNTNRSGFSLLTYKIPEIASIGSPIVFEVEVIKSSPDFTKKYGKQRIILSKYSDE